MSVRQFPLLSSNAWFVPYAVDRALKLVRGARSAVMAVAASAPESELVSTYLASTLAAHASHQASLATAHRALPGDAETSARFAETVTRIEQVRSDLLKRIRPGSITKAIEKGDA